MVNNMQIRHFKLEEIIFVAIAISSIVLETESVVPALASCCLLSFYYVVFCWYLFSVKNEKKILRSILFGILYALIWLTIGICTVKMFGEFGWIFYLFELLLILIIGSHLFLFRNNDNRVFNVTNYWRLTIIITLNMFILFFK